MKKSLNIPILALTAVVLLTAACKKEPVITDDPPAVVPYETGVFVVNEGPFQSGSGTVTFFNRTTKEVKQDIFNTENSRPLGNIVQSITIYDGKAYIVVNNASKVEVVTVKDFKSAGVINNITMPRFMAGISAQKAYVSDWNGNVNVVNLSTFVVSSSIVVGGAPDKMLITGGKAYVLGSAGFTSDSTLHIINTSTDTKTSTLVIGDNPSDLTMDNAGKIWIICGGISDWNNPANNTHATLVRFNPATDSIEQTFDLGSTHFGAKIICNADKSKIYYTLSDGVYEMAVNASQTTSVPVINKSFYALGFDNTSGFIYGADPKDYTGDGWVYRYNPSGFAVTDSFRAGVIPTGFAFN